MAKTKRDFQEEIAAAISAYPTAAQFFQARDPRLLAGLDAMAAQLAMLSAEQDVAAMEPFTKARDMTVLADASVKGVLPFGRPARVKLAASNTAAVALPIVTGRRMFDSQGREYVVDTGVTIPANGSGFVTLLQQSEETLVHTVSVSVPFYRIEIPKPDGNSHISGVTIKAADGTSFLYSPDFVNVEVGALVFNLETDETRTLYAVFGTANVAGYQPAAGEEITVTITRTEGAVEPTSNSPFAFEYSFSIYENGATLRLDSILSPGAAPLDISVLRQLASYPSIYDDSAVYLGNFDFLIRRKLSPFVFLSVWNEQKEEQVRGASVDNINKLFIAAMVDGVDDTTLRENISRVVADADDSYVPVYVDVVDHQIPVAIAAQISAIYDFAAVSQQIKELVDREYGPQSVFAKRGGQKIFYKRLYKLLTENVQALEAQGESDLEITITDPDAAILPEQYRYVSTLGGSPSLTVTITQYGV